MSNDKKYWFKQAWKRGLVSLFDGLGNLFFKNLSQVVQLKKVHKVLLVRIDQLGDVLLSRPAFHLVKKSIPNAQVDLLTASSWKSLLELDETFNSVHGMAPTYFEKGSFFLKWREWHRVWKWIKQEKYDLVIDFRGDLRTILMMKCAGIPIRLGYGMTGGDFLLTHVGDYVAGLHQSDLAIRLLSKVGIEEEKYAQKPFVTKEDGRDSKQSYQIMIQLGAGRPEKEWGRQSFQELIERLLNQTEANIVLIGTQEERERFSVELFQGQDRICNLMGETPLSELPTIMNSCMYYIGHDSGPTHLAAAQGMAGLCLFIGNDRPELWKPIGGDIETIDGRNESPDVSSIMDKISQQIDRREI